MQHRDFHSGIPEEVLSSLQENSLHHEYRGVTLRKNPLDLIIYTRLVHALEPRTIIEIGTLEGGSALWFADLLTTYGVDGHVYSIDKESRPEVVDDRITFLTGDALALGEVISPELMSSLDGPLLVVEDSAHLYEPTLSVLLFFHEHLSAGDYLVVEDGIVDDLPGSKYREYADGPNRAVRALLRMFPSQYEIDAEYCDYFGYNYTFNPNGYLKRLG